MFEYTIQAFFVKAFFGFTGRICSQFVHELRGKVAYGIEEPFWASQGAGSGVNGGFS